MLRGGVQQRKQVPEGGRLMNLDIILVSALPVAFLLFLVGGLIGWVARDYMMNYREVPRPHPEPPNYVADAITSISMKILS